MERKKQDALFFPRVWLYARTGSGHHSVAEQQLVELREWATCNGYSIVGQGCECAQADSFWRPGLFAMLRAVRRGDVDTIATTRLSRLARKRSKLCRILSKLQLHDVNLITIETNLRYQLFLCGLDSVLITHSKRKEADRFCPTV